MNAVLTMPVASPYKSVAEELDVLRATIRTLCQRYTEQTETKIGEVQKLVTSAGEEAFGREKLATARTPAARRRAAELLSRVHDLRDMLTLMRTMQVKAEAGRRKDLKKVESVVEDLQDIVSRWT